MRRAVAQVLLLTGLCACSDPSHVTLNDQENVRRGITQVITSMNDAWRHADFERSNAPLLDEAVMTFNASRLSGSATKSRIGARTIAGQYISTYKPDFNVLSPDIAVTTWENDFARIGLDGVKGPMQEALMTIVWQRTKDEWRIAAYHESTRPKPTTPPVNTLKAYAGTYRQADGTTLRFTVSQGALHMQRENGPPSALQAFSDPDFGLKATRITFIREHGGSIAGVLLAAPDGTSRYAWAVSAPDA